MIDLAKKSPYSIETITFKLKDCKAAKGGKPLRDGLTVAEYKIPKTFKGCLLFCMPPNINLPGLYVEGKILRPNGQLPEGAVITVYAGVEKNPKIMILASVDVVAMAGKGKGKWPTFRSNVVLNPSEIGKPMYITVDITSPYPISGSKSSLELHLIKKE